MKARSPLFHSLLFAAAAGLRAALPPEHVEFFEAKVRPLLAEHCYACHSAAKGKSKGGLQLDTRDALNVGSLCEGIENTRYVSSWQRPDSAAGK